jgi:hypothetical protein
MMQKFKDHLDKIIAVLIIAGCLGAMAWRLVPGGEQAVSTDSVDGAIRNVEKALRDPKPTTTIKREELSILAVHMDRAERTLPPERVDWVFLPRPPFVKDYEITVAPVYTAALTPPEISPGGVWVGKGVVSVKFGKKDEHFHSRALLVWRKPVSEAQWPAEPLMVIKAGKDGAASLPASVSATTDGYEIRIEDQLPRIPYELRVSTVAVFPTLVDKDQEKKLILPDSRLDFQALGGELKDKVQKLLVGDAPAVALLEGGPFVTRTSEAVKVELPSDVQICLNGMFTDDEGNYVQGSFAMRRWIPAREKWVDTTERVNKGGDIKGEKKERVGKELVPYLIDAKAKLINLELKSVEIEKEVEEYQKDPKTGEMKLVKVKKKVSSSPQRIATIRDMYTGNLHQLIGKPDEWWPKDLQIAPKSAEPRPTGPVVAPPKDEPKTVVPTPTPTPTPTPNPTPAGPVPGPGTTPPVGTGPGTTPPGTGPGTTPPVGTGPGTTPPGTGPGTIPKPPPPKMP